MGASMLVATRLDLDQMVAFSLGEIPSMSLPLVPSLGAQGRPAASRKTSARSCCCLRASSRGASLISTNVLMALFPCCFCSWTSLRAVFASAEEVSATARSCLSPGLLLGRRQARNSGHRRGCSSKEVAIWGDLCVIRTEATEGGSLAQLNGWRSLAEESAADLPAYYIYSKQSSKQVCDTSAANQDSGQTAADCL